MLIVWTALFWGLLSVGGSICIAQAAPMFRRGPFGAAFGCGAQFLLPIAHRFCACAGALSSVFLRLCEMPYSISARAHCILSRPRRFGASFRWGSRIV